MRNRQNPGPPPSLTLASDRHEYVIEPIQPVLIARTAKYYLCKTIDEQGQSQTLMVSIAATKADNPAMMQMVDILSLLAQESAVSEELYHKRNLMQLEAESFRRQVYDVIDQSDGAEETMNAERLHRLEQRREEVMNRRLHYDWLFPSIKEHFKASSQGDRQVCILGVEGTDFADLMPLEQIGRQHQRTDLKTNAWIIGRMLKLLGFMASLSPVGVQVSMTVPRFLIGPERHHLVLLDWSNAAKCLVSNLESVNMNVVQIGRCGLELLGVEYDKNGWQYPYECAKEEEEYIEFLYSMAMLRQQFYRHYEDMYNPHQMFYAVVDKLWPKAYHPFTTYER